RLLRPQTSAPLPYTTLFRSTIDALRTWVNQDEAGSVRQARTGKVVAVAGTRGGVGVTTVAAHLARYLTAGSGLRRVIYVDMNLRSEEHTSELQSREKLVCRL